MAREPDLDRREFLETAYMHPALRAVLAEGNLDESDSEEAVGELKNSPVIFPSRRQSESSSSRGSATEKKLLSPEASTPNWTPSRTPPNRTPSRAPSSGSSTPVQGGIRIDIEESVPSGKESSSNRGA